MLKVTNLSKLFNNKLVLDNLTLSFAPGSITAILGPSGSGKSTLLRCLCQLESLDQGAIKFQEKPLDHLDASDIGMVFQNFHLFPHLKVIDNITYAAIATRKLSPSDASIHAMRLLEQFGLADKAQSYPNHLSGGQKQRIAIARALIMEPKILLFDEPTSALDPEMVSDVALLIQSLCQPHRVILVATHELKVAQHIADHVIFLDQGMLIESAPSSDFFKHPQSERAQRFLAGNFS